MGRLLPRQTSFRTTLLVNMLVLQDLVISYSFHFEAWLPRINHRFSSCSSVVFRWGMFTICQLKLSFFNWWWRNTEPILSYVFLRGVSIIRDQFVWEKKLVIGCCQNWSKRCQIVILDISLCSKRVILCICSRSVLMLLDIILA